MEGLEIGYPPTPCVHHIQVYDTAAAAQAFRNMRVYIGHGELEPGLEDVRDFATSLRAEGCKVELAVYRGTGHGIAQPVSSELERILRFLNND